MATDQSCGRIATAQTIDAPDLMVESPAMDQLGFGSLGKPSTISPMMLR